MTESEMIQFAIDAQTQETTKFVLKSIALVCVMIVCITVLWLLAEDFFDG